MRIRTILSTGLAATVATIGLASIATAANASVTYDDSSVGTVGKGDVQTALGGINDATLQSMWKDGKIKFTSKYQMDSTDVWNCSNGSTNSRTSRVMQSRVLDVTAATNTHGKVTSGWKLNGVNENVGGTYLGGERFGAPYVGYCPAGAFTGFAPHVFTNTVLPGVKVNGIDLPVTPVDIPVG